MEENKKLKERDFHVYAGWKTPFFIKFVWSILIIWSVVYLYRFAIPDLKAWLSR